MTSKQHQTKLRLHRETLRELTAQDLRHVVAGTNDSNVATAGRRLQ